MRMSVVGRALLLATGLLAAYQVAVGIEGLGTWPVVAYTIAFGVILIASLLLIIFGLEILETPPVAIAATIIPLGLSSGLVLQFAAGLGIAYLAFAGVALWAIAATRYASPGRVAVAVLAAGHGVAGLIIFGLPLILSLQGRAPAGFALVGLGGALMGVGGLLLGFLRAGREILPRQTLLNLMPALLLAMTLAFVVGFSFV